MVVEILWWALNAARMLAWLAVICACSFLVVLTANEILVGKDITGWEMAWIAVLAIFFLTVIEGLYHLVAWVVFGR